MPSYQIHINGIVQGVGFRPFVYKIANELGIEGEVSNGRDGVWINFNGDKGSLDVFKKRLIEEAPSVSRIETVESKITESRTFEGFKIAESLDITLTNVKLSPDFGLCEHCREDISNPKNHRYGYAFTTCATCGPRYSIITNLPYDRENTKMQPFQMCEDCENEYNNPSDRRHYSQTNSCSECGITISLFRNQKPLKTSEDPIQTIVERLKRGEIVAVKAIGGFLLLVDAGNDKALKKLRERKKRPEKPFALLFKDLDQMKSHVLVSDLEKAELQSPSCPIVLLKAKKRLPEVAPALDSLGCMLPSAPLLQLICDQFENPLVATSGNVSGSPIIYENEDAINQLSDFADLVVTHDRGISAPQDDSVIRFANEERIIVRRSRGLAPGYFGPLPNQMENGTLALGADLKAAFAMSHEGNIYSSQYLGNLESYDAQLSYRKTLDHLKGVLSFKASQIIVDAHPGYFGHQIREEAPLQSSSVQHHEAHFSAVLQENNLMDSDLPVLGIIWDGTGYGADGNSWGGEFFEYHTYEISRIAHLSYQPVLSGDKMSKEPRLSALAYFGSNPILLNRIQDQFEGKELAFYQKAVKQTHIHTSSMGRLFDAVASVLGLLKKSSFEGQGAMLLETLAESHEGFAEPYEMALRSENISIESVGKGIAQDLQAGISSSKIAKRFHMTLVSLVDLIATGKSFQQIAFSGGVFQNALLVKLLCQHLNAKYQLHFHKEFSPNDENIAFGQLAHFNMQQRRRLHVQQTQEDYVLSDTR